MSEVSSTVSGGDSNVVNLSELNFTQLDQLRTQVQQARLVCANNENIRIYSATHRRLQCCSHL